MPSFDDKGDALPYSFKNFAPGAKPHSAESGIRSFRLGEITPGRSGFINPKAAPHQHAAEADSAELFSDIPPQPDPLEEARAEARTLISQAIAETARIRESARAEGYNAGYDEGFDAGTAKAVAEQDIILKEALKFYMDDIRKTVESIESKRNLLVEEHLSELADLAVAVAEKVVGVSLKSSSSIIEKMILSAAEQSKNRQWARIYISKYDANLMMEGDTNVLNSLQDVSDNVKITIMDSGDPGTCIVEFPDQIVDSSVKTQMQNIRDIFAFSKEQE